MKIPSLALLLSWVAVATGVHSAAIGQTSDPFPSGSATPEGAACDLTRAFMLSDVALLKTTCIKKYPPAPKQFDEFLSMIVRGTEEDKRSGVPHPKNPAKIVKVFAARHLTANGPASYGYAVLNLQDVMFVDVLAELHDGSSFVNRTMVVKTAKGDWRVHPCPTIDRLLSAGLNDEADSTIEFILSGNQKEQGEVRSRNP